MIDLYKFMHIFQNHIKKYYIIFVLNEKLLYICNVIKKQRGLTNKSNDYDTEI